MARYTDTLQDSKGRPIVGAFVTVAASASGALASLTNDDGSSEPNPLITDDDGFYYFNVAGGLYDLTYRYGGRIVLQRTNVNIGTGVIGPVDATTINTALGYTPYDAANPQGYVSVAGSRGSLNAGSGLAYNSGTGQFSTSLALLSGIFGGNPVVTSGSTVTGPLLLTYAMTDPNAAASVSYVQSIAAGQLPKQNSVAATTANITLSGTQTIDTVAVTAGQVVLVKNQSIPSQNGLYNVAAGAWVRTTDMDTWLEVPGAATFVLGGGQANTGWACNSPIGGTIGTTAITFVQTSAPGTYTGSGGVTKIGSAFSLTPITTGNVLANVTGSTTAPVSTSIATLFSGVTLNSSLDTLQNVRFFNTDVSERQLQFRRSDGRVLYIYANNDRLGAYDTNGVNPWTYYIATGDFQILGKRPELRALDEVRLALFLRRIEILGAGYVDQLYLNMPGSLGDGLSITLNHALFVAASDTALKSYVQSVIGITDSQWTGLFA